MFFDYGVWDSFGWNIFVFGVRKVLELFNNSIFFKLCKCYEDVFLK